MSESELNIVRNIAAEEARKTTQELKQTIIDELRKNDAPNKNAPTVVQGKDLHDFAQDYISRKGRGLGYIATLPSLAWEGVQYVVLMPITFLGDAILRAILKKK